MSKCEQCLHGLCRRHPLQDHGARAAELRSKVDENAKERLRQAYNDIIKSQLEKFEQVEGTSSKEMTRYRAEMMKEREKAESRKRKKMSDDHIEIAKNTGLHGAVLSLMMNGTSSDEGSFKSEADEDSTSSSKSKRNEEIEHRSKKDKKLEKKKDKHKKQKSKKRRRKERERYEESR